MEMRGLIIRLRNLVDAATILQICGADMDTLHLLAAIEDELKPEPTGENHG